jgi:nicotinamidase/pyrazinamidase
VKRILVDVDTQFDFIEPAGGLYAPAPESVKERIRALLTSADYASVIGSVDSHAYDAWEFEQNGGPFPAHCVKGTPGWLRVFAQHPARQRFVPMQTAHLGPDGTDVSNLVGEDEAGSGNRVLTRTALAAEALSGVALYFEKEVYSLFSNPAAEAVVDALVSQLGGPDQVAFDVIGYCTGMDPNSNHFCVGSAAKGLAVRGYRVVVRADACGPLGDRIADCRADLEKAGIEWSEAG